MKMNKLAMMAVSAVLSIGCLPGSVIHATEVKPTPAEWSVLEEDEIEKAADAGENYKYTVRVYSGKEGYFGNPSSTMVKVGDYNYGDWCTVDVNALGIVLKENVVDVNGAVVQDANGNPKKKYYTRGVTIAGHDNDEVGSRTYQSYSFKVTQDESFSVAYGQAGGMVQYVVNYVDNTGRPLIDPIVYYGMVGDKPVVSYQYVEGYRPNAYNLGKTLSADETQNVITFTYSRIVQPTPVPTATPAPTAAPTQTTTGGGTTQTGTTTTGGTTQTGTATTGGTTQTGTTTTGGTTQTGTATTGGTTQTGTTQPGTTETTGTGAAGTTQTGTTQPGTTENAAAGTAEGGTTGTQNPNANAGAAGAENTPAQPAETTPTETLQEAENTEPAEYIDLDEENVPLAAPAVENGTDVKEDTNTTAVETPEKSKPSAGMIGGIAAAVAAAIAVIVFLLKKRI